MRDRQHGVRYGGRAGPVTYIGPHVSAQNRPSQARQRPVPPRCDGRGRGCHGRARGGPGDPLRGRDRAVGVDRRQGDGQDPDRADRGAARAAHPGARQRRRRAGHALRPEPRQRAAVQGGAGDAQGDHLDRGLPLLPARRARHARHAAGVRDEPGQQRQHPGRLLDHPADGEDDAGQPGQDPVPAAGRDGRHLPAQDQRAALRHRVRGEVLQGLDPAALPQHRLLR